MTYKWGTRSLEILQHALMHRKVYSFMDDVLRVSTVDFSVIDGVRKQSEQVKMFQDGLSELDGIMQKSDHQPNKFDDGLARAIDCIPVYDGDIWDDSDVSALCAWSEFFRAILRVDRLWKMRGLDVGLELGWTYNIKKGRDYPHISFKKL